MPSHAPLSSRDGKIRPPPVQPESDALYYSNDDIELLHQVVALGQEILPTLPKRDRLPTTALFRAADIVFPRWGLDPDGEDKLSRIIFMVGGMRSTDNLLDRFRTVLKRMGIELEYVEEPSDDDGGDGMEVGDADHVEGDAGKKEEPQLPEHHHRRRRTSSSSRHRRRAQHQQQHQPPPTFASPPSPHMAPAPSVHSAAASAPREPAGRSDSRPAAQKANGRRRRNSDTAAALVTATGIDRHGRHDRQDRHDRGPNLQQHQDTQRDRSVSRHRPRRRSDSQAPPLLNYKELFGSAAALREPPPVQEESTHASRPIAPWFSQVPQYTTDAEKTEHDHKHGHDEPAVVHEDESVVDEVEQDQADEGAVDDHEDADHEDADDDDDDDVASVDEYTRSLQMLQPAKLGQQQHTNTNNYSKNINININNINNNRKPSYLFHTHNYQHHQDLALRTRPLAPALSQVGPVVPEARDAEAPANSSMQAAGSWTEAHSSRTAASDYEEFHIPSDTTIQEMEMEKEMEMDGGPPPKVDPIIMAKVADTYFMRFAFLGGMALQAWETVCAAHQEQERYAAQMDRELMLSEALLVWNGLAKAHMHSMAERMEEVQALSKRVVGDAIRADEIVEEVEEAEEPIEPQEPEEPQEPHVPESEAEAEDDNADGDDNATEATEATDDEAAQEFRAKQAQRDRLMRRAARVYTITTLFNAVAHWQAKTLEEISRTKVARRHIVRKKVFVAWRDQTARDKAAAATLTLGWAVQHWVAALHDVHAAHRDREDVARRFYARDLATVAFWTWLRAHQDRLATAWARDRRTRRAVDGWLCADAWAAQAAQQADARARHGRLRAAAERWMDEAQAQAAIERRIEEQEGETYKRAALQDWAKETACRARLRAVRRAHDARTQAAVMLFWRQSAANFQHRAAQLDLDIAEEYATHWQRETRLVLFRADEAFDLKTEAVHSWLLAEKLAFLTRYRDEQLLRKACRALVQAACGTAARQQREARADAADALYRHHLASTAAAALWAQADDSHLRQRTAAYIDAATLASRYVGHAWPRAVAAHVRSDELARRGAFYVGVANAVKGWPALAHAHREQRLRTAYRGFRRQAKRQAAAACVTLWRGALADVGDEAAASDGSGRAGGYDVADELRYEHETHTIFAALNRWILATNDGLFQQSVAVEADAEVYLSRWRLQLAGCEELGAAAAEHDTVTLMAGRWDDWELQAVQARAWQHTAAALHEKNDRRLGRRVLAVWQQQLADRLYPAEEEAEEELEEDQFDADHDHNDALRASYAPTPSTVTRWPGATPASHHHHYSASTNSLFRLDALSPLVARTEAEPGQQKNNSISNNNNNNNHGRRSAASLLLHPIAESPMPSSSAAATPRPLFNANTTANNNARGASPKPSSGYGRPGSGGKGVGSYSVPVPGTSAPTAAVPALYGPSPPGTGPGPLRRLHRSTAAVPSSSSDHNHNHAAPITGSLATTSATLTPGRESSHRHRLLQRRLQSAARLAESVQLGPMSEFDEYDDEDQEEEPDIDHYADVSSEGSRGGADHRPGTAAPARRHNPMSLSQAAKTPTRFLHALGETPRPQQQMRPGGISSAATATTSRLRQDVLMRKTAAAGAAAAAAAATGTGTTTGTLTFDPITTTPMGPLPSPFERRLRAAYGDEAGAGAKMGGRNNNNTYYGEEEEDDDDEENYNNTYEDTATHGHRPAPVAATPLRRPPMRMSTLSMPQTTRSTVGRSTARVTFADTSRH